MFDNFFGTQEMASSLVHFEQLPSFLKRNPYIRSGYRAFLSPRQCLQSAFWWTNETLNIWTHVLGCIIFALLMVYDNFFVLTSIDISLTDYVVLVSTVLAFQFCMFSSAAYHMFCCHSENAYEKWLFMDLLGVTLSLTAIFVSGIHYAFHCHPYWQAFYITSVIALFSLAMATHVHPRYKHDCNFNVRLVIYLLWAAYGVIPTLHWAYLQYSTNSTIVQVLLPRVWIMYLISGMGFFFYITKYPERICPGMLDFIGSSHQWWHILVFIAFYWWHNTGLVYVQNRHFETCKM